MSVSASALQASLHRAVCALEQKHYFKLICGASFSQPALVQRLTLLYAQAGATCVDIGAEPLVIEAACNALAQLEQAAIPPPLLMVSLDLDGDPHFRKVSLNEPLCIACDACLPTCPTDALIMGEGHSVIAVIDPLCYGCGRCVPVCPTHALDMSQLEQLPDILLAQLQRPEVQALELHTHKLDEDALDRFFERAAVVLKGKLLSLCFRVKADEPSFKQRLSSYWRTFETLAHRAEAGPLMIQLDGQPMSGTAGNALAHQASLNAALWLQKHLPALLLYPVTLSGGINVATANILQTEPFRWLAGVGVGSVARETLWQELQQEGTPAFDAALLKAKALTSPFLLENKIKI
jgi:Fe-S-cluster-containing hydrogenase component 2